MQATFICHHCHQKKLFNPRLKGQQRYCGATVCQRARKRVWQAEKMVSDESYRQRQRACLKQWRKKRPLHEYQRQYRQNHPEYVAKNRSQQILRNRERSKVREVAEPQKIVKMDTLQIPSIKSGIYLLCPYDMDGSEKIVKMDALLVELHVFSTDRVSFSKKDSGL
jgi:hypothetical protein